jgi:hypothetical protein
MDAKEAQMTDPKTPNPDAVPDMRVFAEQGMEQARRMFEELMAATRHAVSAAEDNTASAHASARGLHRKAMDLASRNVSATFDLAEKLLQAEDSSDAFKVQAGFLASRMQVLADQARELAQHAADAGGGARHKKT